MSLKTYHKTRTEDVLICFDLYLITSENYSDVRYSSLSTDCDSSMWVLHFILENHVSMWTSCALSSLEEKEICNLVINGM